MLLFRIVNGVMAGLFAFGAVVQYNDPDPIPWMLVYTATSLLCLGAVVRGRVPVWAALGVGVIALIWGLVWSRSAPLSTYFQMFDYCEMKSVPAEEARETSGLFMIAAWMGVLTSHAWFRTRGIKAGFLILAGAFTAYAQDPVLGDPIVVSVSEKALPVSAVSATVTILTRAEIENSHARNVGELLLNTPGLHVSRAGGFGGRMTASIRGGDPNFPLVLIDGVAVNDITDILGGSFDFSTLSIVNVDRIEIVRGPLSSLYGSEAMSGVINIVTRSGTDGNSTDLSFSAGRFFTREAHASHRQKWQQFAISIGVSHIGAEEQVEDDAFHSENLNFNFDVDLREEKRLKGTFAFLRSDTTGFPSNGGGPLFSLTRDTANRKLRQFTSSLEYTQPIRSWWNIRARLSLFDGHQESTVPAILDTNPPSFLAQPSIDGDSNVRRADAYVGNEWRVHRDLYAIIGVGIKRETGRGDNLIAESFPTSFSLTRSTPFVTNEVLFNRGRFGASFAVRADFPSTASRNYSPNVGFTYLSSSRRVRARMGLQWAFKLPSFFALADPSIGNPALRPERNRAIDGGVNFYFGDGRPSLSLTLFKNRFKDLIDFSSETFQLVNRSVVHADGSEAELTVPLGEKISVSGQATFVNTRIEGTTETLRDRPRFRTGASLEWKPTPGWRVRPETRWVSSRADFQIPVPERNKAPGYWNTDLLLDYTRNPFTFFVRLQNLANRKYEEFVGFPNPGFAIAGGVVAHFTK
jgi:vitamin B12 transporter